MIGRCVNYKLKGELQISPSKYIMLNQVFLFSNVPIHSVNFAERSTL